MQSGITTEGKAVLAGMYKYCGTYGLPLGILIDELTRCNCVIDWCDFITDMSHEGAKPRTIRARILEAVELPPKEKTEFTNRLDMALKRQLEN